ncbi:hypothetical protein [Marinobacter sp. F3R11]|uniref:hypothetical protein n=1 Tax=Marinobacter sp. F3R11 TaxID=2267231 RepID=UPI000DEB91EE|nr:hypothetical protein [Marinobacter sp. F3R11]RBW48225.1 hypothetical protein DS878_08440 [Marinobacter sp. F3R11]
MEPIRPDDDELRAERPFGVSEQKKAPVQKKARPAAGGAGGKSIPPKPAPGDNDGSGGRSSLVVLWLVVVIVAVVSVASWYSQNQQIQVLQGQLEEADYWARQSKLALARFEGDLTETGENLQEHGASLAEQLASQKKQIDEAASEIRKLWVVANERNKKRLDDQQERIVATEVALAENGKALVDVTSTLEQVRTSLGADLAALTKQTEISISALEDSGRQTAEQLTLVSKQVADVDQVVERRVRRFEQEQTLGISGIEGRLSALEQKLADLSGNDGERALRNELAEVKSNLQAIDSSRAQLTSRLVRLSEEVNQLRKQVSGQ